MLNFLKGIVAGVGGVAPGVSGSVILMLFGLYKKTIDAVGSLFKNFKENFKFLFPLLAGMGVGVLLFSKVLYFMLENYPMHTRYLFLGMILGTVPMFYKEMTKNGYKKWYFAVIAMTALFFLFAVSLNPDITPKVDNPNFLQSVVMGFAIASTAVVPGNDPAALLSTMGMYECYTRALAEIDLSVLIPFAAGFAVGALLLTKIMSFLLNKAYALTFSVIFGLFISMIPNIIKTETGSFGFFIPTPLAVVVFVFGLLLTLYLGDFTSSNKRIADLFKRDSRKKSS